MEQLGAEFAACLRGGTNAFDAWNKCLYVAQKASEAHMHRRILDTHLNSSLPAADKLDANCAGVLRLCGVLWGAHVIEQDPAFLRLGCIPPQFATIVTKSIPVFLEQLSPIALQLVEAFQFPDHVLAPIANDYIAHNSRSKL